MRAANFPGASSLSAPRFGPKGLGGIYVIGFIVLLAIALLAQLLALKWRPWTQSLDGKRSTFESVRSSVYNFISYIP